MDQRVALAILMTLSVSMLHLSGTMAKYEKPSEMGSSLPFLLGFSGIAFVMFRIGASTWACCPLGG
jgi:hypothetical protein